MAHASRYESYHLDPKERVRVRAHFDADALERLLQHFPAEARPGILAQFLTPEQPIVPAGSGGHWAVISRITDPFLNGLLEDVWRPFWAEAPDTVVSDSISRIPGAEAERERRRRARDGKDD